MRTDTTIASEDFTQQTAYGTYSRVARLTHPTGFALVNVYSHLGYLQEVRSANEGTVYWQAAGYSARGRRPWCAWTTA